MAWCAAPCVDAARAGSSGASPGLGVPGRLRDRSSPTNDPCAVLLGRVGRGEGALSTHICTDEDAAADDDDDDEDHNDVWCGVLCAMCDV